MVDAPNTSSYVLAIADTGDLPNSVTLIDDIPNGIQIINSGPATTVQVTTASGSNLRKLQALDLSGILSFDTGGNTFTTREISGDGTTISVENGYGISGNPTISTITGSSVQLTQVSYNNGVSPESTRPTLNFIPGDSIGITIQDDVGNNRTNITISGSGDGGGGAPTDATYILQTANGSLPDAQALSALSTGLLLNTTSTGVLTALANSSGTNGQVLTLSGGVPTWATGGGGGGGISTITSSGNTLSITNATGPTTNIDLHYPSGGNGSDSGWIGSSSYIGINQSTPLYSLHVSPGRLFDQAAIFMDRTGSQPANPSTGGMIYVNTGDNLYYLNSSGIPQLLNGGGGGAPTDATYITQTPNGSLTNEQALSVLDTGLLLNTTSTGVLTALANSSGIDGQVLTLTGGVPVWAAGGGGGGGTVTSVGITNTSGVTTNGLLVSGSPVTTSGDITLDMPFYVANPLSETYMIGSFAPNPGNDSIGIGFEALTNIDSTGPCYNIAIGNGALGSSSTGVTSTNCTALGVAALRTAYASSYTIAIGNSAATNNSNYTNCTFLGASADTTADGLTNCGSIGYNTKISVSNAINIGTGINLGINQPTPLHALHISNGSTSGDSALILDQTSALITATSNKGILYVDTSNNLAYLNTNGSILINPTSLNPSSSKLGINQGSPVATFHVTGGATTALALDNNTTPPTTHGGTGLLYVASSTSANSDQLWLQPAVGSAINLTQRVASIELSSSSGLLISPSGVQAGIVAMTVDMPFNVNGSVGPVGNMLIGYQAGMSLTTGFSNFLAGEDAGSSLTTGSSHIAIGTSALKNLVAGVNSNIAIGNSSLFSLTSGSSTNLAIGQGAGSTQAIYNNCTFIGGAADGTISGLINSSAFGFNTKISASNAINIGNGVNLGINKPIPSGSLHIGIGATANEAALIMDNSTTFPAATIGSGTAFVANSSSTNADQLWFQPGTGNLQLLNINNQTSLIYVLSGNIVLNSFSPQDLVVSNNSSSICDLVMPAITPINNAFAAGTQYRINLPLGNIGTSQCHPINLKDSTGTAILDQYNNPIVMFPGETWNVVYVSSGPQIFAYQNNQQGLLNGQASTGVYFSLPLDSTFTPVLLNDASYCYLGGVMTYSFPSFTFTPASSSYVLISGPSGAPFAPQLMPGEMNINQCYYTSNAFSTFGSAYIQTNGPTYPNVFVITQDLTNSNFANGYTYQIIATSFSCNFLS